MALQTRDLSKGTAVQVLNEISIEYDFSEPSYFAKSLGKHQELPTFQAIREIFKNKITFSCIGEPAPQKKSAEQNTATKLLEMLSTRYVLLAEIEGKSLIPESKILEISDEISKETLQKWINSCERCFQRGHLAHNCRNPSRNKKYKNNS